MANAQRLHPLQDQLFAGNKVLIKPEAPQTRISLRVGENDIANVEKILGMKLPKHPKTSATSKTRIAMWLGPDEWLIMDKPILKFENPAARPRKHSLFCSRCFSPQYCNHSDWGQCGKCP